MKKAHKLFAVMIWLGSAQANAETPRTLASGAPACGNTMTKKGPSTACRAERARWFANDELAEAKQELALAKAYEVRAIQDYIVTPRRLANGAPACGNVLSKDAMECTAELADLQDARRVHTMKEAMAETTEARVRVHEAQQQLAKLEPAPVARRTEVARR